MLEQFLNDLGSEIVSQIQTELATKRPRYSKSPKNFKGEYAANASGNLSRSVDYNVRIEKEGFEIDIIMLDYGADYLFGGGSFPGGGAYARGKGTGRSALLPALTKWAMEKPGLRLPLAEAKKMAYAVRKNLFKSGYAPIPLFDQTFQDKIFERAQALLERPEYAENIANHILDNIFDRINLFGEQTYEITFG